MSTPTPTQSVNSAAELKTEDALQAWIAAHTPLAAVNVYVRWPGNAATLPRIEIEAAEQGPDPTIRRGVVLMNATVRLKVSIDDQSKDTTRTLWHAVNDRLRRRDLAAVLSSAVPGFHVWFAEIRGTRQNVEGRLYNQALTIFLKCQPSQA